MRKANGRGYRQAKWTNAREKREWRRKRETERGVCVHSTIKFHCPATWHGFRECCGGYRRRLSALLADREPLEAHRSKHTYTYTHLCTKTMSVSGDGGSTETIRVPNARRTENDDGPGSNNDQQRGVVDRFMRVLCRNYIARDNATEAREDSAVVIQVPMVRFVLLKLSNRPIPLLLRYVLRAFILSPYVNYPAELSISLTRIVDSYFIFRVLYLPHLPAHLSIVITSRTRILHVYCEMLTWNEKR